MSLIHKKLLLQSDNFIDLLLDSNSNIKDVISHAERIRKEKYSESPRVYHRMINIIHDKFIKCQNNIELLKRFIKVMKILKEGFTRDNFIKAIRFKIRRHDDHKCIDYLITEGKISIIEYVLPTIFMVTKLSKDTILLMDYYTSKTNMTKNRYLLYIKEMLNNLSLWINHRRDEILPDEINLSMSMMQLAIRILIDKAISHFPSINLKSILKGKFLDPFLGCYDPDNIEDLIFIHLIIKEYQIKDEDVITFISAKSKLDEYINKISLLLKDKYHIHLMKELISYLL